MIKILALRLMSSVLAVSTLMSTASAAAQDDSMDEFYTIATDADNSEFKLRPRDVVEVLNPDAPFNVWVLVDHSRDATVNVRKSMLLVQMNCVKKTTRILQETSYMANGRSVPSVFKKTYGDQYVVPGSTFGALHSIACKAARGS